MKIDESLMMEEISRIVRCDLHQRAPIDWVFSMSVIFGGCSPPSGPTPPPSICALQITNHPEGTRITSLRTRILIEKNDLRNPGPQGLEL